MLSVSRDTRLLVCGQAPGRRVHQTGLSFNDPSGERLRAWMGVTRSEFYEHGAIGVAAMAFCFPGTDPHGSDRPPPPRCAALWRARLLAQLPNLELTLLVGRPAQLWALGAAAKPGMDAEVRAWRDRLPSILPLPHPSWRNNAWLKANPWFEAELAPYLRRRTRVILGA